MKLLSLSLSTQAMMHSTTVIRAIALLGTNVLLYGIMQGLNNVLAPLGLSIYLGGLLIVFPTLALPPAAALIVIIISAFLIDAPLIMPFGASAVLFVAGFYLTTVAHRRIHYPLNTLTTGIAFTLNLGLFICISAIAPDMHFNNPWQLQSLLVNLALSQALLLLAAPWFLGLQRLLLHWVNTPERARS